MKADVNCRMPHYVQMVADWYDKGNDSQAGGLHEAILVTLLENGRLTLEQVIPKPPLLSGRCTAQRVPVNKLWDNEFGFIVMARGYFQALCCRPVNCPSNSISKRLSV